MPLGVLPFPELRGGVGRDRARAPRSCSTPTAWSSGRASTSTTAWTRLAERRARRRPPTRSELCDHVLRDAGARRRRARRRRAADAAQRCRWPTASACELPTEPEALASMRALLRRWLRHAEGTEQEIAEIVTACGEAATNAIEHAGRRRRRSRSAGRSRAAAWRSRCATSAPGGRRARATSGRGLSLMRALDGYALRSRRPRRGPPCGCNGLCWTGSERRPPVMDLVQLEIEERGRRGDRPRDGRARPRRRAVHGRARSARPCRPRRARLVVDFSELEFIDSSGIAMLFGLARRLGSRRQELRVVARGRRAGRARARDRRVRPRRAGAPDARRRRSRLGRRRPARPAPALARR